jgi:hypothetical protein
MIPACVNVTKTNCEAVLSASLTKQAISVAGNKRISLLSRNLKRRRWLPSCAGMVDAERLTLVWQHLPPAAKIAAFFVLFWRLFCDHMARRPHNWNYRNITDFLKSRGFSFSKELGGSHQAWIKKGCGGAPNKVVEINFTHRSYPPGTLKTIIRQSGIAEDEWITWTRS